MIFFVFVLGWWRKERKGEERMNKGKKIIRERTKNGKKKEKWKISQAEGQFWHEIVMRTN